MDEIWKKQASYLLPQSDFTMTAVQLLKHSDPSSHCTSLWLYVSADTQIQWCSESIRVALEWTNLCSQGMDTFVRPRTALVKWLWIITVLGWTIIHSCWMLDVHTMLAQTCSLMCAFRCSYKHRTCSLLYYFVVFLCLGAWAKCSRPCGKRASRKSLASYACASLAGGSLTKGRDEVTIMKPVCCWWVHSGLLCVKVTAQPTIGIDDTRIFFSMDLQRSASKTELVYMQVPQ